MMKLKTILLFAILLSTAVANAQCKYFTRNKCMPAMAPYVSNGQYNGATLFEGESAVVSQTFYSGQNYRMLVCAHSILGEGVYYVVKDIEGTVLYNSNETGELAWDFQVASTQQLSIEVFVPESNSNLGIKQSGCVSILVGFKE